MIARIGQQRAHTARISAPLADTTRTIGAIDRSLFARPEHSVRQASTLVGQIADSIVSKPELAIDVMGDTMGAEELDFICHNVTILSSYFDAGKALA